MVFFVYFIDLVCLSTQFTKQTYFIDIIGGILIAEIVIILQTIPSVFSVKKFFLWLIKEYLEQIIMMNKRKVILNTMFLIVVFSITCTIYFIIRI